MNRVIKFLLLVFLFPITIFAQQVAVTATITDGDGQNWSNGTWSVQLVSPGGTPVYNGIPVPTTQQSGSLNSSGNLSVTLYYTATIGPAGAYYNWIICPLASFQCSVFNLNTVSSNMTSLINPHIVAPRFPAGATSYGYSDAEVYPTPPPGGIYYNVLTPIQRIWNGTAWINNGSGSGGGGTVTSVSIGTTPSWLSFSVANPNTAAVISAAASPIPNSALANSSTSVNGQTCTLGASCTITASATSIAVGTTTITGGTSGDVLIDNAGVLGNTSTLLNIALGTTTTGQAFGGFSSFQIGDLDTQAGVTGNPSVLEGVNALGTPTWILTNQTGAATFPSMTTPDAIISGGSILNTPVGNLGSGQSTGGFSTLTVGNESISTWITANASAITGQNSGGAIWSIFNSTGAATFQSVQAPVISASGASAQDPELNLTNTSPATSTINQPSAALIFTSQYWNGSSTPGDWSILGTYGTGSNPSTQLTFTYTGSTGNASVLMPALNVTGQTSTGYLLANSPLLVNQTSLAVIDHYTNSGIQYGRFFSFGSSATNYGGFELLGLTNTGAGVYDLIAVGGTSGVPQVGIGTPTPSSSCYFSVGTASQFCVAGTGITSTPASRAAQFIGTGGTPTISLGLGAGTSPSIPSISGTNTSGTFSFTSGTSPTANTAIAVVTFFGSLTSAPNACSFFPMTSQAASNSSNVVLTSLNSTEFTISSGNIGISASQLFVWGYICI